MSGESGTMFSNEISGDWWWVYALFRAIAGLIPPNPDGIKTTFLTQPAGCRAEVRHGAVRKSTAETPHEDSGPSFIGAIEFTGEDETTTFTAVSADPRYDAYWSETIAKLKFAANDAYQARRYAYRNSAEGAIEYYYRARAQGSRITMAKVSAVTGFSESYLRKVKVEYDRAGKWGSKQKGR